MKNEWISVYDWAPDEGQRVLVAGNYQIHILILISLKRMHWIDDYSYSTPYTITHWMPLPEPPKNK